MANYCCTTRTNYFKVKDGHEFEKFIEISMPASE